MRRGANLPDRGGVGAGWPKPQGTTKEGKGKSDSLETIYKEIEKLLRPYRPPLKALSGGVKGKNSLRLTVPKPVAVPGVYEGKPTDLMLASVIQGWV